jgi:hypothetical protein
LVSWRRGYIAAAELLVELRWPELAGLGGEYGPMRPRVVHGLSCARVCRKTEARGISDWAIHRLN